MGRWGLAIVVVAGALGACSKHDTTTAAQQQQQQPQQPAPAAHVGEVTAVSGEVTVTTPAKPDQQPVTVGMAVTRDMTFHTGAGASVDVRFDNRYTWSLAENRERAIADVAIIDRSAAPEAAEEAVPAPAPGSDGDDVDRTASAGRHSERSAAETPAETMVKPTGPKHTQTKPPPPKGDEHDSYKSNVEPHSPTNSASCDEVACALDPTTPCCKKFSKGGGSSNRNGSGSPTLPDTVSREDIQNGIKAILPRVAACFDEHPTDETVYVKLVIGPDGGVTSAIVDGDLSAEPIAACVTAAVKSARFPRAANPTSVRYPFRKH